MCEMHLEPRGSQTYVAVQPPLELRVGKCPQTALLGQVLLFGHRAVTSGDLTLALLWPQCQVWENLHFLWWILECEVLAGCARLG